MSLRWKQFEKRMEARLRPYDARRLMGFWQRVNHYLNASSAIPLWGMGGIVSGFFISLVLTNAGGIRAHPDFAMASLGLWAAVLAVLREGLFWNSEQLESDYAVLWMLPLGADRIFWRHSRGLAAGGVWLLFELLVVYAIILCDRLGQPAGWAIALLFALLQTGVSMVLTALMVALKVRMDRAFMLVALGGVVLPFALHTHAEFLVSKLYCLGNPFAWLSWVVLEAVVRGKMLAWWLLAPVAAVSASLPFSLRAMRRLNQRGGFRVPLNESAGPSANRGERAALSSDQRGSLRMSILSGDALWRSLWNKSGIAERLLLGSLSARERDVAELLLASEPSWTRRLLRLLVYLALFLAIGSQVRSGSLGDLVLRWVQNAPGARMDLLGFLGCLLLFCFMAANAALMFGWNSWPERLPGPQSERQKYYRTFRLYPASFWEAAKTITKINTMIFVLLLPVAVLLALSSSCQLVFGQAAWAVWIIPKSLVLIWGMTVFIACFNLLPNDPNPFKYWMSKLGTLAAFFSLLALGVVLMAVQNLICDVSIGACFILAVLGWLSYSGWRYRRGDS